MANSSLNLAQVIGGSAIKQGDTNTKLGYELLDKNGGPIYSDIMSEVDDVTVKVILTELKEKTVIVITNTIIKTGTVIFTLPAETTPGRYNVEIAVSVKGQTAVFPSTYASVTLEIVKSYFMARPDDTEVKYINIGGLPSASDISKLQKSLDKLQAAEDIARIDHKLDNAIKDISDLEDDISDLEDSQASVKSGVGELSERLAKMQTNLYSLDNQLDKHWDLINAKVNNEDLESKLNPITSSINSLGARLDTQGKRIDIFNTELKALPTKDDISTIDASITDITTKLNALRSKVEAFKAGMSEEEKAALDNKLSVISELQTSVASIKDDISSKADTTSLEPINVSIKSLETKMESKASKEDLNTKLEATSEKLAKLCGDLVATKANSEDVQTLSKEISDIKTKLESNTGGMSESEKQELNAKLTDLESRMGKVKNKNPNGKDISMWLGTKEELSALSEEDLNDDSTIYIRS